MYKTDGCNIKIPRGDSAAIPFTFTSDSGEPYIFYDGQYARLDVFPVRGAPPVITKTVPKSGQSESGTATVALTPEDTDIPRGEYVYTLRLLNADGTLVDTRLGSPEQALFEIC